MCALSPDALYELRAGFVVFVADSDGRIEFAEFCQLMAELEDELSREECQLAFQGADGDDDGSISFDEFAAWWTGG